MFSHVIIDGYVKFLALTVFSSVGASFARDRSPMSRAKLAPTRKNLAFFLKMTHKGFVPQPNGQETQFDAKCTKSLHTLIQNLT